MNRISKNSKHNIYLYLDQINIPNKINLISTKKLKLYSDSEVTDIGN